MAYDKDYINIRKILYWETVYDILRTEDSPKHVKDIKKMVTKQINEEIPSSINKRRNV